VPKVTATLDQAGASLISNIAYACMCMEEGMCSMAVVSYGDNPRTGDRKYYARTSSDLAPYGVFGAAFGYAFVAQRYLHKYGKQSIDLAPIPLGNRKWAQMNPNATYRQPMTLEDHQNCRFVIEPLRLFDCTSVTDGAAAVIVTSAERARDLAKKPVYINGYGQGHVAWDIVTREDYTTTGALRSGEIAFRMAGVEPEDMDFLEIYDCFSITPVLTLEDYGYCKKGEGLDFVADNKTHPGGSLPMSTSGGLLSETGMPGMQHIVEGVRQLRGECGERQVPKHEICAVSNQGGHFHTHSTFVLATESNAS
jgi:acetyl-CoA acetyltransferase